MMPCTKRMTVAKDGKPGGCKIDCLHRKLVTEYKDERIRQEDAAEEASIGYRTEYLEYIADHPLITFKEWLVGHKRNDDEQSVAA